MPTTPLGIEYPLSSDPVRLSYYYERLATTADAAITTANATAAGKTRRGQASVTFNASGDGSLTHGAGWVPVGIHATPILAAVLVNVAARSGSAFTSTLAPLKAFNAAGAAWAGSVSVYFTVWRN